MDKANHWSKIASSHPLRTHHLESFIVNVKLNETENRPTVPDALRPDNPEVRKGLFKLYRNFFDKAERRRRWSVADDIPWELAAKPTNPAIADVIESFCAVELYLPDYVAKAMPLVRTNRGWSSFHANWGYEESKHSLALADWLLRSGSRTEEQMADLEGMVATNEYHLPQDNAVGMLVYAMIQELATFLHYRNLRRVAQTQADPALNKLLGLVSVDEAAHHAFYAEVVQFFLSIDRAATLEQLRRILVTFQMPAVHLLADSQKRVQAVKALGIFDQDIFARDVYLPILKTLGISHRELRRGT
jgi:acyl-[acyl-carrier-protein] desaturase